MTEQSSMSLILLAQHLTYQDSVLQYSHIMCMLTLHYRCGPCKQFTPVLAQFYADMNKKGKKFEIVFVSRDNTEEQFVSYFQRMPWLAVTLDNLQYCLEATNAKFSVKGIPYLVVLDGSDASIYTLEGRQKIAQDQYGLEFPWAPRSPAALMKKFIPRSVRELLAAQVGNLKKKLVGLLHKLLAGNPPGRLLLKVFGSKV